MPPLLKWRSRIQPAAWCNLRGAVAHLGERCVRNAEVEGSIPFGSTFQPAGDVASGFFDARRTEGRERRENRVSWAIAGLGNLFPRREESPGVVGRSGR